MMKLALLCCFLTPTLALAQALGPNQIEAAMGSEIMECVSSKVQLRARLNAMEAANAARPAPSPQPTETPK